MLRDNFVDTTELSLTSPTHRWPPACPSPTRPRRSPGWCSPTTTLSSCSPRPSWPAPSTSTLPATVWPGPGGCPRRTRLAGGWLPRVRVRGGQQGGQHRVRLHVEQPHPPQVEEGRPQEGPRGRDHTEATDTATTETEAAAAGDEKTGAVTMIMRRVICHSKFQSSGKGNSDS